MEYTIIQAVLPPFAIVFLGYIYSVKDGSLDMKSIANMIYYIFSPCLVFSSLAKRALHFQEFLMISFSVVILIFTLMFITLLYMKITSINSKGFYLPIIFMATGNIALPMALALYGDEGLSKAIIFHLVNVLFMYSMGVFLVSRKTDFKEFFRIPHLYAAIVGVFVANVHISVPEGVAKSLSLISNGIDIIGKGAIPLLIFSLGYSLRQTRLADFKHGFVGAGLRILVGPVIAFGLIAFYRYIGLAPVERGYDLILFADLRTTEAIIILMGSMPAPIASFLLNEKFDDCPEKAASMVLIGTVAVVLTIPFVLTLSHRYIFGM